MGFEPGDGIPDGMAVDVEGHVWVALFGGGCVRRYAPGGLFVDRIELPVSQPTSVAFGGDDLEDLYITTATYQFTAEQLAEQPLAGATFVCRLVSPAPRSGRSAADMRSLTHFRMDARASTCQGRRDG